jgi:hypothetical protein
MRNKIILIVIILLGISSTIFPQNTYRKAIFLHRSVGANVYGPMEGSPTDVPTECHVYNVENNYTGADSIFMYEELFPTGGNAWYQWRAIFDDTDPVNDIYQYIENYDIIIIKTCYTNGIAVYWYEGPQDTLNYPNDQSYYNHQWHLRHIINIMGNHPDKFFVIWTPAMYTPLNSPPGGYILGDNFAYWMTDTLAAGIDPIYTSRYGYFPENVHVYDYFHDIDSLTYLPVSLALSPTDNHPNGAASDLVAPLFVKTVFDAAISYESGNSQTFQLSVPIQSGWNLVSIPGLHPVNQNVNTWWLNKDPSSDVFRYNGVYQSTSTVIPGNGYMMKHNGAQVYNTGDEWPAVGIQLVPHDPIAGTAGWNIFGGYELSVTAANVTTNPPGLQSGPIYKFSGGYQIATTIDPGYGYWINLTAPGQIIIPETLVKSGKSAEWFPKDWGRLIVTDAAGKSFTLYSINDKVNLDNYKMPPLPPTGNFDIRYNSGRIAEDLNSSVKAIDMSGVTYPLTVRVEGMDIRLMDESGKMINTNLKSGEDVVIRDATIQKLMVSGEMLPTIYSLEQNYPNPFNPSTVIEFSLPEDAANVKLSIYNALGEKVAELVNTSLTAGKYQYQWNVPQSGIATGVYIYELRTDRFISVKKMILIR